MELALATLGNLDITDRPWQEQLDFCMERVALAKDLHAVSRLALGQALYHLKTIQISEGGYLKFLFQVKYDTWSEFVGSPEVDIAPSTARNLMAIWTWVYSHQECVSPEEVIGIGHRKMAMIMPALREGEVEWLDEAKQLTSSDLRARLDTARGKEEAWEIKPLHCPLCDTPLSCEKCGWS